MASATPPLTGLRVLEFAGLAPGPFAGKLLADYGASVLRIDRATATSTPAPDLLAAHKRSIRVNLKSPAGTSLLLALIPKTDILIDPFRPGVLESLGLGPSVLLALNPRLIYARLVGFQREGKYAAMAGHDINYLAVSGLLSMLGRAGAPPHPPGNVVGDFAGGGLMCVLGVLLALVVRAGTGRGQVVEANMVDGSAYLGSFPRFAQLARGGMWAAERGRNLLDGGAPFYDTYETRDGGFMALGALEPRFYEEFITRLLPGREDVPDRMDPRTWPALRELFRRTFLERDRKEWEAVFDGTDACVTPVKTHAELRSEGFRMMPPVTLVESPAKESDGWEGCKLKAGGGGKEALEEWWGMKEGKVWVEEEEGVRLVEREEKAKL